MSQKVKNMIAHIKQIRRHWFEHLEEYVTIFAPRNGPSRSRKIEYLKYDCLIFVHSSNGHCLRVTICYTIELLGMYQERKRLLYTELVKNDYLEARVDCLRTNSG